MMSERSDNVKPTLKLTILKVMIKGYHKCSFAVGLGVGEKFVVKKLVNDHRLHMLIAVRFRFILKKFNYEFFYILSCF